mgnify:CR=1 FL=1
MNKNVLVLCTGNSCRSQLAHGFLENLTGDNISVYSAGVEVHGVNPNAISTMKRAGIDISKYTSNHVDEYEQIEFDLIFTVCDNAKERCPYFPSNAKRIHHNFTDPAKATGTASEVQHQFDVVRDEIKGYCEKIVEEHL